MADLKFLGRIVVGVAGFCAVALPLYTLLLATGWWPDWLCALVVALIGWEPTKPLAEWMWHGRRGR